MRRTILSILIGLCLTWPCAAQNPNPQSGFAPTVLLAGPSLYLNFNDTTTSFADQISGQSFTSASPDLPLASIVTPLGGNASGYLVLNATPMRGGTLSSISVQFASAPPVGPLTIVIATPSSSSITINSSFSVTVAATTSVQTFTGGGVNFPTTTVAAGQIIGSWVPSSASNSAQAAEDAAQNGGRYYTYSSSSVPSGTLTIWTGSLGSCPTTTDFCHDTADSHAVIPTITGSTAPTIYVRQPGFDSTLLNNTSAEFPWSGYSLAPNNTLGAIEWSSPWSKTVQVDRLNWSRTGTLVLASKGSIDGATNYWKLYLQMSGNYSQLCFQRYSAGITNGVCTNPGVDVMPNGFNYNIAVTDTGTGGPIQYNASIPNPLTIYVNGLTTSDMGDGAETAIAQNYAKGFGAVNLAVSGGTGYANSTAFTSTGGGTNCIVTGLMTASGGVPTGITTPSAYANLGCTSVPTIVLTSPTGTGATITATLLGTSMNSTTSPLMVPGYLSGGTTYGIAGTNAAQPPTYIDEFAIFPFALNKTQIHSIFYWTKFYQSLLGTAPTSRVAFIFDDDGCGDEDNFWALQGAIAAERAGYVQIEGVVQEESIGFAASVFRQMLDQAGLSNVPVGVANSGNNGYSVGCTAANLITYNASTYNGTSVYAAGVYPTATTVYREVMAANPTNPVMVFSAGQLDGMAEFMQSPADSISSLTGLQLWNQDAANGAKVYTQGGGCTPSSYPATSPCTGSIGAQAVQQSDLAAAAYVYANNGAMPMIAVSDTPQSSGPGPLYTRTGKDPMFLFATGWGSDTRQAWDSLPMSAFITPYFTGGVTVGYSGGTGYAAQTTFTSTGGGANCNVQGIMTASGGVPNGITTTTGQTLPLTDPGGNLVGLGYGCTSAPTLVLTSPTGTGVTLTAYLAQVCGTASFINNAGIWSQSFATGTCSNHYVSPMSMTANQGQTPIFQWFLNSLIDPPPNGRPLR